ncbi:MAG: hypothetical protein WC661_02985 [Opitutaceae bacterium]
MMLIARLDGWSLVIVAGGCALISLVFFGDLIGAVTGLLVAGAGVLEIRGGLRLRQHDADGMDYLVRAQWIVITVIWAYALRRIFSFDAELMMANYSPEMRSMLDDTLSNLPEETRASLQALGLTANNPAPFVHSIICLVAGILMVVTLVYQGGLALYYRNRRETVRDALTAPPEIPAMPRPRPTVGEDVMDN